MAASARAASPSLKRGETTTSDKTDSWFLPALEGDDEEHTKSQNSSRLENLGKRLQSKVDEVDTTKFSGIRTWCYRIANNTKFHIFIAILIFFSFIVHIIDTDHRAHRIAHPDAEEMFTVPQYVEDIFTVIFLVEVVIRALGSINKPAWRDMWLVADALIVGFGALDAWILEALLGNRTLSGLAVLRTIRALRAVRLLRIVRFLTPLRILAEVLGEAFADTAWLLVCMLLFTFSAAIVFTGTVGVIVVERYGTSSDPEGIRIMTMFESVPSTMVTLNILFLRGFYWGPEVLEPAIDWSDSSQIVAGILLLAYTLFTLLCLVNLISGMFISSLTGASKRDADPMDQDSLSSGVNLLLILQDNFKKIDKNGDGFLTYNEFRDGLSRYPEICKILGVDATRADTLFKQLDDDGSNMVGIDEFLIGLMKMTRMSKTIDMLSIDYQQQKTVRALRMLKKGYEEDLVAMRGLVAEISGCTERVTQEFGHVIQELTSRKIDVEGSSSQGSETNPPEGEDNSVNTPTERVMAMLEARFGFKTRTEKLEQLLQEVTHNLVQNRGAVGMDKVLDATGAGVGSGGRDVSTLAPESEGADGLAALPMPSDDAVSGIWNELLETEIMPWLRTQLATIT